MALKKLSITEQEAQQVRELLAEGLSHYKISERLKINRIKIWKNVQLMGVEKKKKQTGNSNGEYFSWTDFNNSVI